jgi:HAMP domain-containing protein
VASAVTLDDEQREVALAEAQAVLTMVQDERRRERLAELVADVDEGQVSESSAAALEEILELGLATGRLRALYGPDGEQAALLAFRKLPRGAELAAGAREVSEALAALEGRRIDSVSLANTGPGAYVLSLATDGLELSVRVDRQGARVHSVGI